MARVLKHSVVLRRNPPSGDLTVLKVGDTLPDWAEDLVGEHLFENARGSNTQPKEVERKLPSVPVVEPEEEPELTVPSRKASAPAWRKFAKEAGVTNLPAKMTRDEIIEKILEVNPDLEIPEE